MNRLFEIIFLLILILLYPFEQGYSKSVEKQIIRVLAIGNSFSEDAIENNLYDLSAAAGKKMVIGNLYIGGAPIALHLSNAMGDKSAYSYRKITDDGRKQIREHVRLSEALSDEEWDYISFQQASPLSGLYTTYENDLPALMKYVAQHVRSPHVKYVLHQTWAYQRDSDHEGFAHYDRNQERMYHDITSTTKRVFDWGKFNLLVPCGTAIQNARTTYIGDHFTRDGYHLNLNYGRFIAACTWFEVLFHSDVRKNSFIPLGVSHIEADLAKDAAHAAVQVPFDVTPIKSFQYIN